MTALQFMLSAFYIVAGVVLFGIGALIIAMIIIAIVRAAKTPPKQTYLQFKRNIPQDGNDEQ